MDRSETLFTKHWRRSECTLVRKAHIAYHSAPRMGNTLLLLGSKARADSRWKRQQGMASAAVGPLGGLLGASVDSTRDDLPLGRATRSAHVQAFLPALRHHDVVNHLVIGSGPVGPHDDARAPVATHLLAWRHPLARGEVDRHAEARLECVMLCCHLERTRELIHTPNEESMRRPTQIMHTPAQQASTAWASCVAKAVCEKLAPALPLAPLARMPLRQTLASSKLRGQCLYRCCSHCRLSAFAWRRHRQRPRLPLSFASLACGVPAGLPARRRPLRLQFWPPQAAGVAASRWRTTGQGTHDDGASSASRAHSVGSCTCHRPDRSECGWSRVPWWARTPARCSWRRGLRNNMQEPDALSPG